MKGRPFDGKFSWVALATELASGGSTQRMTSTPRVAPTLPFTSATVKKPEQATDRTR
jgi:hypothetical protein